MSEIDDLYIIDRMIREADTSHRPSLQDLMDKTERSKGTVLKYIKKINEIFEESYPDECDNKKMIKNSKEKGKEGYYYYDSSYSLIKALEVDKTQKQNELKDKLVAFLKKNVTNQGLAHPKVNPKIKRHIESTNKALDRCKTLQEVIFYYDQALEALTGKEDVAAELQRNHLKCFESQEIREIVDSYKKFL